MDLERRIRDELAKMARESGDGGTLRTTARRRIRRRRLVAASAGVMSALLVIGGSAVAIRSIADRETPRPQFLSGIPDEANIRCDPGGGVEMPGQVRPQPDGVHLRFAPLPGMKLVEGHAKSDTAGLAIEIIEESSLDRVESSKGAGPRWYGCIAEDVVPQFIFEVEKDSELVGNIDSLAANFDRLDVVDPEDLYADAKVECDVGSLIAETAENLETAQQGDPLELTQERWANDLQERDVVRYSGYPEARGSEIVVTRGPRTILEQHVQETGDGGYLLNGSTACSDALYAPDENKKVPDVAEVVCEEDGVRIVTPQVRPQRDGVHIHIENTSGRDAAFVFESGGRDASGTLVLPIAPGSEEVGCVIGFEDAGKIRKERLHVVDPEGLYVTAGAECPGGIVGSSGGLLTPDARGERGDPVQLTRERFADQIKPGDEVLRAGYPDDPEPVVAIVRGGRTMLTQEFLPDGEDRWFLDAYNACADF